ncbi:MAG TPA: sulfurtransferase [Gemmataceae bacterium]|nr:sulfurtransferase [Gemmataceae bacterium]
MTPHLLCTALLLLTPGADAKGNKYPHADLLVEASELAKAVPAKKVRLLDTRAKAKYDAGHVPGAVRVDVPAWGKSFAAGPDKDTWTKLLGDRGLDPSLPVVVYGDDVRESARAWWILRYWGFKEARLLNGGWSAWAAANGAASREAPAVEPTNPKLTADAGRLATRDQVIDMLKGKDHQIVDTRSEKEYCGEQKMAKRGGAIPGAKHLEWSDLLDKDGRFKSTDELRKLFKEHDVSLKEPAVTYCQSGGRASVMAFALELMGAKDVRNYYRSWNEWGNDPDTPIVIPKK